MKKSFIVMAGVLSVSLIFVRSALAIPTFARKYKTSCTTCHSPVPIKLNNFGQAFKNLGYHMPGGDEKFVKTEEVKLGSEGWEEVWKEKAIYPGAIPAEVPLSFQIYLDARWDPKDETKAGKPTKTAQTWFDMPHEFELMTAGTGGKNISWWGNVEFKKGADNKSTTSQTVEVVNAWGQFDSLSGSLLNIRMGLLEPRAVPFSRMTRRFLATDLFTSDFRPLGRFGFKDMQSGIEFWGVKSMKIKPPFGFMNPGGGFEWAFGLVNGGGMSHGDENTGKDFYTRLSLKLGGMGVGEALEEEGEELRQTENWIDNSIRLGLSTYNGSWGPAADKFRRLGFDVDLWVNKLNLYSAIWQGRDHKQNVTGTAKSSAFTVVADYIIKPWATVTLRYGKGDKQKDSGATFVDDPVTKNLILGAVFGIRPNITWTIESVTHQDESGGKKQGDDVLRSRVRFIF